MLVAGKVDDVVRLNAVDDNCQLFILVSLTHHHVHVLNELVYLANLTDNHQKCTYLTVVFEETVCCLGLVKK